MFSCSSLYRFVAQTQLGFTLLLWCMVSPCEGLGFVGICTPERQWCVRCMDVQGLHPRLLTARQANPQLVGGALLVVALACCRNVFTWQQYHHEQMI